MSGKLSFFLLPYIFVSLLSFSLCVNAKGLERKTSFDLGWKFCLGDEREFSSIEFSDSHWRSINLPHDWSIEDSVNLLNPTGGGGGFFCAGKAWYRKTFFVESKLKDNRVLLEFEGIYMNSEIWLNGELLYHQPYGYSGFFVDLTSKLHKGARNVLAIKVDNSAQPNSRWYSGSGIYRHVWLHVLKETNIAPWGVFVKTNRLKDNEAEIEVLTDVENGLKQASPLNLETSLFTSEGICIGKTSTLISSGKSKQTVVQKITVSNPPLWSVECPKMCKAVSRIYKSGKLIDQTETGFGIRTIEWSVEKGLQINGKPIKIIGGCIHHDHGCLGAKSYDRAEERKVELLKSAGFNAVRTAHNPPAPAFLRACDRLGMLVMDEAFDCWERSKTPYDYARYFNQWWKKDLEAMLLRDRNHPSVIFWSIGNEIPDQSTTRVSELTGEMVAFVKNLDKTRPVTEGIDNLEAQAGAQAIHDSSLGSLDIVGYNYGRERIEKDHLRIPSRMIVITESVQNEMFECWKSIKENNYVVGDFVWTAMDYLGENGIGRWGYDTIPTGHGSDKFFPYFGSMCGDIDITGERKPISHYRNIVWNRGEKLYLCVRKPVLGSRKIYPQRWGLYPSEASWTWPGFENKQSTIDVYSRCDSVLLFQDGKLIGGKVISEKEKYKAEFDVIYRPGELKAVGYEKGKPIAEQTLKTAGETKQIRLIADRSMLHSDGQDLAFVTIELTDSKGIVNPIEDRLIQLEISGPAEIVGAFNSNMTNYEWNQGNQIKTHKGKALIVVKSLDHPGEIKLFASTNKIYSYVTLQNR
jgi:beta-galactosidase